MSINWRNLEKTAKFSIDEWSQGKNFKLKHKTQSQRKQKKQKSWIKSIRKSFPCIWFKNGIPNSFRKLFFFHFQLFFLLFFVSTAKFRFSLQFIACDISTFSSFAYKSWWRNLFWVALNFPFSSFFWLFFICKVVWFGCGWGLLENCLVRWE